MYAVGTWKYAYVFNNQSNKTPFLIICIKLKNVYM